MTRLQNFKRSRAVSQLFCGPAETVITAIAMANEPATRRRSSTRAEKWWSGTTSAACSMSIGSSSESSPSVFAWSSTLCSKCCLSCSSSFPWGSSCSASWAFLSPAPPRPPACGEAPGLLGVETRLGRIVAESHCSLGLVHRTSRHVLGLLRNTCSVSPGIIGNKDRTLCFNFVTRVTERYDH